MSRWGPPIRSATSVATCCSVRRTILGGSEPPSSLPDNPMAVGTHPGYRTWTCTPRGATSWATDSLKADTAALDAA